MLYNCIKEQLTPNVTIANTTAAQTVTFNIRQQQARLEAVLLTLKATTASAANNADGLPGLVKEIRIVATDMLGRRNIVKVSGPALLSFLENCGIILDRNTLAARKTNLATTTAYQANFYIPLRHPTVAEPYGNLLSLPLSANFIKGDASLEVDLHPGTTVSTVAPTAPSLKALAIYRQVPDSVPYIPTELATVDYYPNTTAKTLLDLETVGFLSGILVQGYSAVYGAAVTRVHPYSTNLAFLYGREKRCVFDADQIVAINDLSIPNRVAIPSETTFSPLTPAGESFIDFMTDHPQSDAFSIKSCQNLNTDALGGDKARLEFENYGGPSAVATLLTRITTHKFLAREAAALAGLTVAI